LLKDRIREIRRDFEWSQEQLGARLGITKSAVSMIESGKTMNLKSETLARLTSKTGYSIDWIQYGKGPKKLKQDGDALTPEILSLMHHLDPHQKGVILSLIKTLLGEK
jgi:transcriptional regulator with XRE-family HTH domain